MIGYMKRIAQVVVLTAVLVFGALLVLNSGVIARDVQAGGHSASKQHLEKPFPNSPSGDIAYHIMTVYK